MNLIDMIEDKPQPQLATTHSRQPQQCRISKKKGQDMGGGGGGVRHRRREREALKYTQTDTQRFFGPKPTESSAPHNMN